MDWMCGSGSLVAVFQSANAKVYIDGDASAFTGRVFVGQDGTYAKSAGAGFFNLTANGTWFGIYNRTPHDVALAALEDNLKMLKERNWGWALWNLRGTFGPIDSGREDVTYEDWNGHKLDRRMLELLKRY